MLSELRDAVDDLREGLTDLHERVALREAVATDPEPEAVKTLPENIGLAIASGWTDTRERNTGRWWDFTGECYRDPRPHETGAVSVARSLALRILTELGELADHQPK